MGGRNGCEWGECGGDFGRNQKGNYDSSKKIIGNDGGVYFSKTQVDGSEIIASRNNNYVTSQFYTIGVAPSEMFKDLNKQITGRDLSSWTTRNKVVTGMTDVFLAGAQDNGTQFQTDRENKITSSIDVSGGDGAASMFSQNLDKPYFIANYVYNNSVEAYDFKSDSDCEVWLPIYKVLGLGMFELLDAEFVCVLYDKEKETLVAARDPLGIRPLFYGYSKRDGSIIFSSEVKGIIDVVEKVIPFPPGHYYTEGVFTKYSRITDVKEYHDHIHLSSHFDSLG